MSCTLVETKVLSACRSSACMCAIMHYVHALCVAHSTHFLLFPAHPSHFSLFITAITYCTSTVTYIILSLHHFWYTVVYVSKSPFSFIPVNEDDNYIVVQMLICCNHSFWAVKLDDTVVVAYHADSLMISSPICTLHIVSMQLCKYSTGRWSLM